MRSIQTSVAIGALCAALGLALPPGAEAKPRKNDPAEHSSEAMCTYCGGSYDREKTACAGADRDCCWHLAHLCWQSCRAAADECEGAECNEAFQVCQQQCFRNRDVCTGGKDPAIGPGAGGRNRPGGRSVAPATPEPIRRGPGTNPARTGDDGSGAVLEMQTPPVPKARPTAPVKKAPTKPGFIWVDDHWERPRAK